MQILIVNSELSVADDLRRELADGDFDICTAGDGEEALRCIHVSRPEMVVLDLLLPGKDGFEVLREMKADEDMCDVPVIVMSDCAHQEDINRCLAMGACDYVAGESAGCIREVADKIKKKARKRK